MSETKQNSADKAAKTLTGTVVSNKMDKTIAVAIALAVGVDVDQALDLADRLLVGLGRAGSFIDRGVDQHEEGLVHPVEDEQLIRDEAVAFGVRVNAVSLSSNVEIVSKGTENSEITFRSGTGAIFSPEI